jgi:NAD(P)H-flavin reductase/hemoglobin-like flavoprotein
VAIALNRSLSEEFPEPDPCLPGQQRRAGSGRRQVRPPDEAFYTTGRHSGIDDEFAAQNQAKITPISGSKRIGRRRSVPVANGVPEINARLIKETFTHVEQNAQHAMNYFYSRLFVQHPQIRAMFPLALDEHVQLVFATLARLVWSMDSPAALDCQVARLGRDHRKYGVKDEHCQAFFDALLATVRHFTGHFWTPEAQAAWETALDHVSACMQAAAASDARHQPPWWTGEIVQHDRRAQNLAVLTVRPSQPLRYLPGQYLAVQVARWPREWRNYSIANAPRQDGHMDLHVRAVPGGLVSNALVHHTRAGDTILLGRARGSMTLHMQSHATQFPEADLLCIAGGTGLAPIKAIIEAAINAASTGRSGCRKISLFLGARHQEDLYDMEDLAILQSAYRRLTVIPVVSDEAGFSGLRGRLPDIVRNHANCAGSEIFVSGPPGMVHGAEQVLARRTGAEHIHYDPPDAPR